MRSLHTPLQVVDLFLQLLQALVLCWIVVLPYDLLVIVECLHIFINVVLLTDLGSQVEPQVISSGV